MNPKNYSSKSFVQSLVCQITHSFLSQHFSKVNILNVLKKTITLQVDSIYIYIYIYKLV